MEVIETREIRHAGGLLGKPQMTVQRKGGTYTSRLPLTLPGVGQTRAEESTRELRNLLWCSIDNDDSRDLDQLTVAEAMPDGAVKVLVLPTLTRS
jgi:hypothetical protein